MERFRGGGVIMRTALVYTSVLLLAVAATTGGQDDAERQELLERQRRARERIEALDRERHVLLFRRTMSTSDSRYLLLDIRGGKGTLNYRDRVLRDFAFTRSGTGRKDHGPGMLLLARKTEGKPADRMLLFGDDLVLRARKKAGAGLGGKKIVGLELGQKDLAAIFFALDMGAPAYIVP